MTITSSSSPCKIQMMNPACCCDNQSYLQTLPSSLRGEWGVNQLDGYDFSNYRGSSWKKKHWFAVLTTRLGRKEVGSIKSISLQALVLQGAKWNHPEKQVISSLRSFMFEKDKDNDKEEITSRKCFHLHADLKKITSLKSRSLTSLPPFLHSLPLSVPCHPSSAMHPFDPIDYLGSP